MTQKKLKGFVLPTIYLLAITTIVISIIIVGRTIRNFEANDKPNEDETNYVTDPIIEEGKPVVQSENDKTIKPYFSETVTVKKEFYDKTANESKQQNSLIYYEGTYMQNTGVLYTNTEEFEVIATMDGKISNIKEDELLGFIVEIEHTSNLKTIYQSVKDIKVSVGQDVKIGEVIALSGSNKIDTTNEFNLLVEVYHNGKLINPENYYGMEIKTLTE